MSEDNSIKCFICSDEDDQCSQHWEVDYGAKNDFTGKTVHITFSCDFTDMETNTAIPICPNCLRAAITNMAVYMDQSEPKRVTKSDLN